MSISIKFDIDVASAQSQMLQLSQGVQKQKNAIQKGWQSIKTNYVYYSQLSSILLSNLAKAAESTSALSAIQGLQIAQTAIIGQIAVFQTAKQAAAALFGGNIPGFLALSAIAAALQLSVAAALNAAIESDFLTRQSEEIRRQFDAYNI